MDPRSAAAMALLLAACLMNCGAEASMNYTMQTSYGTVLDTAAPLEQQHQTAPTPSVAQGVTGWACGEAAQDAPVLLSLLSLAAIPVAFLTPLGAGIPLAVAMLGLGAGMGLQAACAPPEPWSRPALLAAPLTPAALAPPDGAGTRTAREATGGIAVAPTNGTSPAAVNATTPTGATACPLATTWMPTKLTTSPSLPTNMPQLLSAHVALLHKCSTSGSPAAPASPAAVNVSASANATHHVPALPGGASARSSGTALAVPGPAWTCSFRCGFIPPASDDGSSSPPSPPGTCVQPNSQGAMPALLAGATQASPILRQRLPLLALPAANVVEPEPGISPSPSRQASPVPGVLLLLLTFVATAALYERVLSNKKHAEDLAKSRRDLAAEQARNQRLEGEAASLGQQLGDMTARCNVLGGQLTLSQAEVADEQASKAALQAQHAAASSSQQGHINHLRMRLSMMTGRWRGACLRGDVLGGRLADLQDRFGNLQHTYGALSAAASAQGSQLASAHDTIESQASLIMAQGEQLTALTCGHDVLAVTVNHQQAELEVLRPLQPRFETLSTDHTKLRDKFEALWEHCDRMEFSYNQELRDRKRYQELYDQQRSRRASAQDQRDDARKQVTKLEGDIATLKHEIMGLKQDKAAANVVLKDNAKEIARLSKSAAKTEAKLAAAAEAEVKEQQQQQQQPAVKVLLPRRPVLRRANGVHRAPAALQVQRGGPSGANLGSEQQQQQQQQQGGSELVQQPVAAPLAANSGRFSFRGSLSSIGSIGGGIFCLSPREQLMSLIGGGGSSSIADDFFLQPTMGGMEVVAPPALAAPGSSSGGSARVRARWQLQQQQPATVLDLSTLNLEVAAAAEAVDEDEDDKEHQAAAQEGEAAADLAPLGAQEEEQEEEQEALLREVQGLTARAAKAEASLAAANMQLEEQALQFTIRGLVGAALANALARRADTLTELVEEARVNEDQLVGLVEVLRSKVVAAEARAHQAEHNNGFLEQWLETVEGRLDEMYEEQEEEEEQAQEEEEKLEKEGSSSSDDNGDDGGDGGDDQQEQEQEEQEQWEEEQAQLGVAAVQDNAPVCPSSPRKPVLRVVLPGNGPASGFVMVAESQLVHGADDATPTSGRTQQQDQRSLQPKP